MEKTRLLLTTLLLLLVYPMYAQQKLIISGNVKDTRTGEDLIGATITIKEIKGVHAITNAYGFYSITLPAGKYQILAQFMGYAPQTQQIELKSSVRMDFLLAEQPKEFQEVVVTSSRRDENVTSTQMGVQKLSMKEINNIPVIFGERDILKTIQLLPGIQPVSEGSSGFYVRGGASDQNLILLDEATVYNASHLMGFFSVFNSDAIKDVTVYKGNEPAEYGGRLSSVLDIKMNDGNDKKFGVSGGIGLIDSRINVEGPIVKDKGSFSISARRTYADLFLKLSKDSLTKTASLYFYDLNVKANYQINNNNRIFLSGYFGKDALGISTYGLNWANTAGTFRWNHLFNQKLFSNTSLIYSNYNDNVAIDRTNSINIESIIQDFSLKQDFQYYASVNNKVKFGYNSTYYQIVPGTLKSGSSSYNLTNKYCWENAAYLSDAFDLTNRFKMDLGLRLTAFSLLGPGTFHTYNADGNVSDSTNYASGKFIKTYFNLEPRLAFTYLLTNNSSIKASYDRNTQNLHLITNSTTSNPTSLWFPSSNNMKPETADQFSFGYYKNFNDDAYELSAEIYYKKFENLIDYKNGAQLNFNEDVESQLLFGGNGRAYGLELYAKKKYGIFTGWLSYTLSRAEQRFEGINLNHYYPSTQDRTQNISLVGIYDFSPKWTFSANWVYLTGNPVSFPSGKYQIDGVVLNYYTERNGYRMPPYHRLDLSATYILKKTATKESSWTFSLYNAYNRSNAYSITFQTDPDNPQRTEAVQTTLFKIVPSVTYNFKF